VILRKEALSAVRDTVIMQLLHIFQACCVIRYI